MSTRKRHHYVPQFYLEGFVREQEDGRRGLWVYDKGGESPRLQQPSSTAVERFFYRIEVNDGESDDSTEEALSRIEGEFAPILRGWLAAGGRPRREDLSVASVFVALMDVRTPRSAQIAKEITTLQITEELKALATDPDRLREYLAQRKAEGKKEWRYEDAVEALATFDSNYRVEITTKYPLAMSLRLADDLAATFASMGWCLCRAPSELGFITSDAPVCKFLKTGEGRALFGGGLGHPAAQVTFPLSPEVCLLLDRTHRQHGTRVGREFVAEINRRTAFHAERYVFSAWRSKGLAALVAAAAKTRSMPKIDREEMTDFFQYLRNRRRQEKPAR